MHDDPRPAISRHESHESHESPSRPLLSAFLIAHNEAATIEACLASLRGLADEIVVLDDGSTDETADLARRAGARVFHRPFDGFGTQKQAALELATGEWVFSIDADERVTPPLAAEIGEALARGDAHAGYWVRRRLIYLGVPLRFGGTGRDWVLRLARRNVARVTPRPVHERMVVTGTTGRLRGTLNHVQYSTLSEHLAKIDRYTTIIAGERAKDGRRFRAWHLLRIPWEMFSRLVLRLGILDGRAGVIHAAMASYYGFLKSAKLWSARSR